MLDVEVEPDTGRYVVNGAHATVDAGEAVRPDGIRNQIEGGILRSPSWTGREVVEVAGGQRGSFDWSTYPVLRFGDVPRQVDVQIIDHPGAPVLGVGEAAQGTCRGGIRQCDQSGNRDAVA